MIGPDAALQTPSPGPRSLRGLKRPAALPVSFTQGCCLWQQLGAIPPCVSTATLPSARRANPTAARTVLQKAFP